MTATIPRLPDVVNKLLRRSDQVCVSCDTSQQLVCPTCDTGFQCQFIYPTGCNGCPRATCVASLTTDAASPSEGSGSSGGSSTNVGAIAGGVVGGLAALAIVTFLLWKFCIAPRRKQIASGQWDGAHDGTAASEKGVAARRRENRNSTQTTHSIASTVLTRASNIIQIAYIPGVTNRATPTSPTLLVPPVPPIPINISQANSPTSTEDQHFFVPGDLRDSTYSGLSGLSDRESYAHAAYGPRSSVASTIYGKNAVIVAPAQTGMRAKPAMVSVKSATTNSGTSTPPVPTVDYDKYNTNDSDSLSPAASTFSVGSTFLNNATTASTNGTPAKPTVVRVGSTGSGRSAASRPGPGKSGLSEELVVPVVDEDASSGTLIDLGPPQSPGRSPFSDPPSNQSSTSLSAVIEDATRRASQRASQNPATKVAVARGQSPFGDEHAQEP